MKEKYSNIFDKSYNENLEDINEIIDMKRELNVENEW